MIKIVDFESIEEDYDSYKNPIPGKTYVSPPLTDSLTGNRIRIVTRGIMPGKSYEVAEIKKEIVLRETEGGKKIIKATVFEDSRRIKTLSIQDYTPKTGKPHKNGHAFVGEEITKLADLLRDVQIMHFGSEKYQRLSDIDIEHMAFSESQAEIIVKNDPELFTSIVQSKVSSKDIIAVAYRKKQLDIFYDLLSTSNREDNCIDEKTWQTFFEKNTWIFGYGLGYIFLTGLDNKKLEQTIKGFSLNQSGKRIDAVMKTRGLISNLCFVEIKRDTTKLLKSTPYRSGCFAPSDELVGAVSQVQGSSYEAAKAITEKTVIKDNNGNPTGEEVFNYQSKSFLVIGSLSEFMTENGVNQEMLRSFELYRKNIVYPEIITFDELYERARFIVRFNEEALV